MTSDRLKGLPPPDMRTAKPYKMTASQPGRHQSLSLSLYITTSNSPIRTTPQLSGNLVFIALCVFKLVLGSQLFLSLLRVHKRDQTRPRNSCQRAIFLLFACKTHADTLNTQTDFTHNNVVASALSLTSYHVLYY